MPEDKLNQIREEYRKFIQKVSELRSKRLQVISEYRKKADAYHIEKIQQDIQKLISENKNAELQ